MHFLQPQLQAHLPLLRHPFCLPAPHTVPSADVCLQADAGAQVVQIFDSWASHLSPQDFDVFSGPYIKKVRCRSLLLVAKLQAVCSTSSGCGVLHKHTCHGPECSMF
jgi:hypothetical protein